MFKPSYQGISFTQAVNQVEGRQDVKKGAIVVSGALLLSIILIFLALGIWSFYSSGQISKSGSFYWGCAVGVASSIVVLLFNDMHVIHEKKTTEEKASFTVSSEVLAGSDGHVFLSDWLAGRVDTRLTELAKAVIIEQKKDPFAQHEEKKRLSDLLDSAKWLGLVSSFQDYRQYFERAQRKLVQEEQSPEEVIAQG